LGHKKNKNLEKAGALVEFALTVPIFLIMIFGAISILLSVSRQGVVNNIVSSQISQIVRIPSYFNCQSNSEICKSNISSDIIAQLKANNFGPDSAANRVKVSIFFKDGHLPSDTTPLSSLDFLQVDFMCVAVAIPKEYFFNYGGVGAGDYKRKFIIPIEESTYIEAAGYQNEAFSEFCTIPELDPA